MLQRCGVQRYTIYKQNRKTMKRIMLFFLVLLPFCALSQVNETFDGTVVDPKWIGKDRDQFVINADGQLQLGIEQPATSGEASIGMNITYAPDMQWEFDIWMSGVPSDNNKLWIYLYREEDVYYNVQIGYSGNQKLGLRSNGKDMFARRVNDYKKDSRIHIKVTLEENRYWTMYSRRYPDTYYVKEGSSTHPIVPVQKGQFSFKFVYTKTMSQLFCIDNVKILHQITPTDTIPKEEPDLPDPSPSDLPQLEDIQVLTPSALQFIFNKEVNIEKAVFAISDIGQAIRKNYADETKRTVNTLFAEEMQTGNKYTISYEHVKDASGNNLPVYSTDVILEEEEEEEETPESAPKGSVLINEVMADPKGLKELPETEYVELYNTTNQPLSLAGWEFSYGGSVKPIGDIQLQAGSYAVLYRSGRDIEVDATGLAIPLENFPSSLANTGKTLQLLDATGSLIDEVTYAKATPARSWERSAGQWLLSTDPRGGTPGSQNSSSGNEEPEKPEEPDVPDNPADPEVSTVLPGEIVFNELLPDPFAGGSEYIELYNRSGKSLSLSGLSIATRKSDGSLSTRYSLSSITSEIAAGGFALLTKDVAAVSAFYLTSSPKALFEVPKLPVLANTSSTLVLFRAADEAMIDEVGYSSKWHASSIKSQKGVALERINPEAKTQEPANWTSASATAGYGTPGYRNSQYGVSPEGDATGMEAPVYIEEGDYYLITYLLDKPGYNCRAFVFDTSGRRVAEISSHELLGTEGQLVWNGKRQNGNRLQTGVYVFYAALYHPDGKVVSYKKVFLVH